MEYAGGKQVDPDRTTSPGCYISEVAWRDFYTHVLAAFPRVSMGRPYLEKFSAVVWEKDVKVFEAWTKGMTGVPIVDAAMRQGVSQGSQMTLFLHTENVETNLLRTLATYDRLDAQSRPHDCSDVPH